MYVIDSITLHLHSAHTTQIGCVRLFDKIYTIILLIKGYQMWIVRVSTLVSWTRICPYIQRFYCCKSSVAIGAPFWTNYWSNHLAWDAPISDMSNWKTHDKQVGVCIGYCGIMWYENIPLRKLRVNKSILTPRGRKTAVQRAKDTKVNMLGIEKFALHALAQPIGTFCHLLFMADLSVGLIQTWN